MRCFLAQPDEPRSQRRSGPPDLVPRLKDGAKDEAVDRALAVEMKRTLFSPYSTTSRNIKNGRIGIPT